MDIATLALAALLGIVEGLTEFIPVSSTGHLILLVDILGFKAPPGHVFEVAIQLGSILAVCWLYRKRLWQAGTTFHRDRGARHFVLLLLLGFLPAMVIGAVAHGYIKSVLFSPKVVSVALIIGGIAMILIEKRLHRPRYDVIDAIPLPLALKIGFFQCIAMIPGVSRSGATIMGGLLLGVDRKAAAEFSFFLAIPTMFAATVYDLYKHRDVLDFSDAGVIAIGFVAAFLSALLVVRTVIAFVSRHGFVPFAVYRIILGTLMLLMLV